MAGAGLTGKERGKGRPEPAAASRRPVWALGLLLMVEVAGIAALGVYEFLRVDWQRVIASRSEPSREVTEALLVLAFFGPAVVLTLLSGLSLLLIRRRGWLLAAISQGLVVAACLWLYAEYELYAEYAPAYVYPIMAYAVLMILYLNVHDVRAVFYPGDRKRGPRRIS